MDERWGGDTFAAFSPDWEDGVSRTTEHEPQRAARLKALGNSIVPQVAYAILLAMGENGRGVGDDDG